MFFRCAPLGYLYFFSFCKWTRIGYINRPGMAYTPYPSSVRMRRDSNPWPLNHESSSISTRPDFYLTFFSLRSTPEGKKEEHHSTGIKTAQKMLVKSTSRNGEGRGLRHSRISVENRFLTFGWNFSVNRELRFLRDTFQFLSHLTPSLSLSFSHTHTYTLTHSHTHTHTHLHRHSTFVLTLLFWLLAGFRPCA